MSLVQMFKENVISTDVQYIDDGSALNFIKENVISTDV